MADATPVPPPDVQNRAGACLARGRQKALAAETLWDHEQYAEALRLRRAALDEAVAAAKILAGEGSPWTAALTAGGLSTKEVATVDDAHRAEAPLPEFDEAVDDHDDARYLSLARAHRAADRALTRQVVFDAPKGPARHAPLALVGAMLLAGGAVVVRHVTREKRTATASAFLDAQPGFPAPKAIDGDAATEWLLPHGQTGWIEVQFQKPRTLRAVRVLNAHNRTFNDLATREYRVEAFAGDRSVGLARGAFAGIDPMGPWARHAIVAQGVTRVRVWIDSFHGATGGLGEIDFE